MGTVKTAWSCVAFLSLLVWGCSGHQPPMPTVETALAYDRFGIPTDPTGNSNCNWDDDGFCNGLWSSSKRSKKLQTDGRDLYQVQIRRTLNELERSGKKKILIFVHGGLNSRKKSLSRARVLAERISQESDFYPLFIIWRSSLRSSYKDHVLFLRQGKIHKDGYVLLSPFYFLADVLRGVARAPVVWAHAIKNTYRARESSTQSSLTRKASRRLSEDEDLFWENNESCEEGRPSFFSRLGRGAALGVTLPTTKLLTAPFIDAFGTSAWKVMQRRTETLFARDAFFRKEFPPPDPSDEPDRVRQPQGGLAVFLTELSRELKGKPGYEITLVGHSMGAMVVNRIVRDFGDQLPIRNLVFMAAASSLEDYRRDVLPFVVEKAVDSTKTEQKPVDVYHLTLHRKSEVRQIVYGDLPSRGTLLVWLDDFLSDPRTTLGRTAGRVNKLMRIAAVPGEEAARPYVHIKAYGVRCHSDTDPQRHGHFSGNFRFWEPACWEPATHNQHLPDGRQCFSPDALDESAQL